MWMKQLVGRLAGQVVDVPFSAAEASEINGTAVRATDEEVIAAGHAVHPQVMPVDRMAMPAGYSVEPTEAGGYDLFDPSRLRLNEEPYPNIAAALSAAHDHREVTYIPLSTVPVVVTPPVRVPTITLDQYRFEAVEGGGIAVFDPAGARLRDEVYADDDAAFDAARAHYAASRGMTPEQLDAEEADATAETVIAVPDDWKGLHHKQRRALAQRIKGQPVANTAEADEAIEEYVTRPR